MLTTVGTLRRRHHSRSLEYHIKPKNNDAFSLKNKTNCNIYVSVLLVSHYQHVSLLNQQSSSSIYTSAQFLSPPLILSPSIHLLNTLCSLIVLISVTIRGNPKGNSTNFTLMCEKREEKQWMIQVSLTNNDDALSMVPEELLL